MLLLVLSESLHELEAGVDGVDNQAIELADLRSKLLHLGIVGHEAAKSYRPSLIAVTVPFTVKVALLTRNVFGAVFFAFPSAFAASFG